MIAYTLQSNIFALIVLMIVYRGVKNHTDLSLVRDRAYLYILFTNAVILLVDSIAIFFYDVPGQGVYVTQSILKSIFFALNPLPGFLWIIYVYDYIFNDPKVLKRLYAIGVIPIIVNVVLAIASIWGGYLFLIGEGNSYQRGSLFYLVPIFAFSYTIFAFIMILFNLNRVNRQDRLPLLLFAIPPVVGGLLQTFIYGMVTLWPSLTISLLIIYVFIQSKSINTDFLTGLYNRRSFDFHLDDMKKWHTESKMIAGFMMDMDDFKVINDTYGHQTGDQALIEMSQLIKESFRHDDYLARLGGDEFVAVIEIDQREELESIMSKLAQKVADFNQNHKGNYQLSISCGCDVFDQKSHKTLDAFFEALDQKMYQVKQEKKQSF